MLSGLFGVGQPVGASSVGKTHFFSARHNCLLLFVWAFPHPINMSICGVLIQLLLSVLSSQPGCHTTPSRIKQPSPVISLKYKLKASQLQRLSLSFGLVPMGIPGPVLNPVVLAPGFYPLFSFWLLTQRDARLVFRQEDGCSGFFR